MTPHDQVPWGDDGFAVARQDPEVGRGMDGTTYDLLYDTSEPNPDGAVCNALSTDGTICRLPRGHWDVDATPHQSFDADLVVGTGIYVIAIHRP